MNNRLFLQEKYLGLKILFKRPYRRGSITRMGYF
uniref:Uncharacterized protein n=1 Tax=Anguilla anguilla TaxID=7936 RepID=A0A0E9XWG6_ANGAN